MRVLITDGNERVALAVARSLQRARHSVSVVAPMRRSLAACRVESPPSSWTLIRSWTRRAMSPSWPGSPDAIVRTSLTDDRCVPRGGARAPRGSVGGNCRAGPISRPTVRPRTKSKILEMARASGFGGPLTRVIDRPGTHLDREFDDMFPAVIKPHRSVVTVQGVRRKLAVVPVPDATAVK